MMGRDTQDCSLLASVGGLLRCDAVCRCARLAGHVAEELGSQVFSDMMRLILLHTRVGSGRWVVLCGVSNHLSGFL